MKSISDVARSFGTTQDAIKVATDNKDAFKQLFGQNIAGAQQSLQALKDGAMKVPESLDAQKLGAYYRLAQDYINANKDATGVQAVRLEVLQEAYRQVVK